ncbi:CRAL-TRIO lipid binding domain - like 1, partial [Theobroma cacao]
MKKGKESGKIQDHNMPNEIDNEAQLDANEQVNGQLATNEEKLEPPSGEEDEKKLAAVMEMKRRKKKALIEFRCRIEDAILGNSLLEKPKHNTLSPRERAEAIEQLKEITLWGVPMMPSKRHGGTDNSPGPATKELRSLSRKAWMLFQDHYPELIHRSIIINVPLWYYVSHVLSSRLKTQRRNSKIVFARPGRVSETLLKFVSPENLPVEYGGLKRENDNEFSPEDKVLERNVRASISERIQIPAPEAGVTILWDLTVVGWDVSYKEEFVPDDEGSYKVLLQIHKEKKGGESVRNSFYIREPGKIVITIDNFMLKRKKVLCRYKTKPTVP